MLQTSEHYPQSQTKFAQLRDDLADGLDPDIDVVADAIDKCKMPVPTEKQRELLSSTAKRKVVACGRQVGKTMTAGMSAIGGEEFGGRGLLDGAYVHIAATTSEQSDPLWEYLNTWLEPLFNEPGFYKNNTRRIIKYRGGQIRVRTGYNPDSLRGGNVDKLILDECAYLDPTAWRTVGMPMLLARNGVAEFYSTPKRRNWFWELFVKAKAAQDEKWYAWNFGSHENPHLSDEAMELLTEDMTDDDYKQEILAKFLASGGAVFRYVDERSTGIIREPYPGVFVFGVDWGKQQDYTVITVIDAKTGNVVDYDRFNQINWSLQRGRLITMYEKWKPVMIYAEANSIGEPNIEALWAEGLPVEAFWTTAASKPPLIESLILAFDRGEITSLDDEIMKHEIMAYERKVSSTGRSQYNAPPGMHDDCVISVALAWYGKINYYVPAIVG